MKKRYYVFLMINVIAVLTLISCSNSSAGKSANHSKKDTDSTPIESESLKIAFAADPDTLDWMYTGASATRDVGWHIFETLFALDDDYEIEPMLAEDYDMSEDEKEYTIHLREGVQFHDGTTVKAEDAIASIERWRKVSDVGKTASEYIDSIEQDDEWTFTIQLNEAYSSFISDFAAPKSALTIMPATIAEDAGAQPLEQDQLIGTGPYQFKEWDRGEEIVLKRFDDYVAREEEDWGGLTGKKEAYFNELQFQIVKDSQVMLNGLKTDLYDYAQAIPADLYDEVENDPNLAPITYINGYSSIIPNKAEAPFDEPEVRQALNEALDNEMIAKAAYGNEAFYDLDGALFDSEQKELYTNEGTEDYFAHDPEKAKALLDESHYDGEEVVIMFANNYDEYEKIGEIAKQQLEEVGFNVKLDSYEWATYLERWENPENWNMVVVGWSTRFSPNELGMLSQENNSSGWYESDQWQALMKEWASTSDDEELEEILAEMNKTVYDELPFIKVANVSNLDVKNENLETESDWVSLRFWNTWKNGEND